MPVFYYVLEILDGVMLPAKQWLPSIHGLWQWLEAPSVNLDMPAKSLEEGDLTPVAHTLVTFSLHYYYVLWVAHLRKVWKTHLLQNIAAKIVISYMGYKNSL